LKELKVHDSVDTSKPNTINRYQLDSLDEGSEFSQGDMINNMQSTFDVAAEKGDIQILEQNNLTDSKLY
jgi:hypothetical protein